MDTAQVLTYDEARDLEVDDRINVLCTYNGKTCFRPGVVVGSLNSYDEVEVEVTVEGYPNPGRIHAHYTRVSR